VLTRRSYKKYSLLCHSGAYHAKFLDMGGFEVFHAIFMEEIDNPNPDLRKRECCLLVLKNLLLDGKHSLFINIAIYV